MRIYRAFPGYVEAPAKDEDNLAEQKGVTFAQSI
jgi:hypothetical protein